MCPVHYFHFQIFRCRIRRIPFPYWIFMVVETHELWLNHQPQQHLASCLLGTHGRSNPSSLCNIITCVFYSDPVQSFGESPPILSKIEVRNFISGNVNKFTTLLWIALSSNFSVTISWLSVVFSQMLMGSTLLVPENAIVRLIFRLCSRSSCLKPALLFVIINMMDKKIVKTFRLFGFPWQSSRWKVITNFYRSDKKF